MKKASKKEKKELKLHFGSELGVRDGFVGVPQALATNMKKEWTWKAGSVSEVHVTNILQYMTGADRITFMNRLAYIMAPGAQANILVPHAQAASAWMDPMSVWPPLNEGSFLYFNKQWRETNKIPEHYGVKCDFDFGYGFSFQNGWQQKSEESRQFALVNYNNVVSFLQVTLTKKP